MLRTCLRKDKPRIVKSLGRRWHPSHDVLIPKGFGLGEDKRFKLRIATHLILGKCLIAKQYGNRSLLAPGECDPVR